MKPRQGRAVFSVIFNFTETVTESHTCQKVSGQMSASGAQTTWEAWLLGMDAAVCHLYSQSWLNLRVVTEHMECSHRAARLENIYPEDRTQAPCKLQNTHR